MMRGAQSGGVVTFEPTKYTHRHHNRPTASSEVPPLLKGIRSRVVNAKRSDLSKRLRQKIIQDNCSSITGNLRGWDKAEYTLNDGGGKLVRGFFGHTRFATSSKASFDGTHPHMWSKRREYSVYSFRSASASSSSLSSRSRNQLEPRIVGVENYITHNGDFEFFRVKDKYYDVEVLQAWLEKVLETPMPATVDSGEYATICLC